MQILKSTLKKIGATVLIPVVVYMVFAILRPAVFVSGTMVYSVCLQSITTCILAWGISFSMTAGIVDFSVAAERILGSVLGVLLSRTMGIAGLLLGCAIIAVAMGILKGILNSVIKMSSMVISVAYCYIIGALGAMLQGSNSMILTKDICVLGQAPAIWIVFVACGAIIFLLHHYSVFGANCRALGGNGKIASDAGVSKAKTEAKAILVASLFGGISGIVATSYGAGTAAQTGLASMSFIFPAIIGFNIGALLQKYVDITFGCVAGVVTMNILATGLISLGIPSQLKDTVTGAFLLILMCTNAFLSRKRADALRRQSSQLAA